MLSIACGPAPDGRARTAVVAATTAAIGEGAAPIPYSDCALIYTWGECRYYFCLRQTYCILAES